MGGSWPRLTDEGVAGSGIEPPPRWMADEDEDEDDAAGEDR